jgi:predicted chitinase
VGVTVSLDQLIGLAPDIRPAYREAFSQGQPVLERYAISDTPLRVAHFVAQTLHESGAYALLFENLNWRGSGRGQQRRLVPARGGGCLGGERLHWVADSDNIAEVSARINGGAIGLAERMEWTRRTRLVWCQRPA